MNTENDPKGFFPQRNGDRSQSWPSVQTPQSNDSEETTLDLGWLFSVVRRRMPVMAIVAVALSAVFGGILFLKSKEVPPKYQGNFRLLIEPISAEGRLVRQFLLAQASGTDLSKIKIEESGLVDYETQIRVLKSPKLLSPILEKLQEKYPKLSYKSLNDKLSIDRISVDISGKEFGTKILEIHYSDTDPDRIISILEEVAEQYLEYSLEERLTSLDQGIEFINKQLPNLQTRVDTIQTQIQILRQQDQLIEPYPQAQALSQEATSLNLQQLENQKELATARSLYESLQQQLAKGNATAVLSQEPQYQQLLAEAQKLESRVAEESGRLQADSLPMRSLFEQQEAIHSLLQEEARKVLESIRAKIEGLEVRQQAILQADARLDERMQQWPVTLRQYAELEQELEVATNTLTDFLGKREALSVDAAQQQIPWALIAPPDVPRNAAGTFIPSSVQQIRRQIAIATILSTLLGIGAGFLVEVLHTVFHNPEEIKGATRLPILAVIPYTKKIKRMPRPKSPLAPQVVTVGSRQQGVSRLIPKWGNPSPAYITSPFSEAFRTLYANLRLLGSEGSLQSLTIGSAMPADGKSTVALYLAQTAAAIGLRVLLVDADLRRPHIHQKLGLPNEQGLSDVLSTEVSLNDIIQKLPDCENLFVLTAGPIPPDSIKLLSSKKMQYVMEQFKGFFDLAIYDTPPLTGLSDGNLLAANTDGLVMVVALEKTDRNLLARALEGLKLSGASILGIVANQ